MYIIVKPAIHDFNLQLHCSVQSIEFDEWVREEQSLAELLLVFRRDEGTK